MCVLYNKLICSKSVKIHFLFEINYVNEFGLYPSIVMGGFGNVRTGSNETSNFGICMHFDRRQSPTPSLRSSHDHPLRWRALERNGRMVHKSPHRIRTLQSMHIKHNKFARGREPRFVILERPVNITPTIDNRRYIIDYNKKGNSIHMDKLFLFHHMKRLNEFLHYRILDVSSIKIVVNNKLPKLFYSKKGSHRALDDIIESIEEMRFYLQYAFKWQLQIRKQKGWFLFSNPIPISIISNHLIISTHTHTQSIL